ncbi:MAG TPA: hypothetical protein VEK08_21960 [Planctomycetota bacterium]|nr:hypothetical protein [Planctomycetota bacterium]
MSIRGVRRPEEVKGLGLSSRLLIRVGALLKKKVAISLTVLETAKPGTPAETLLLNGQLLTGSDTLDTAALQQLVAAQADAKDMLLAISSADDGFRVVCFQEELDAGEGWGAESSDAHDAATAAAAPAALTPVAGSALRNDTTSTSETLVSGPEIERARLKLMTAADPAERTEALRTLAFAPLSSTQKLDALLIGLSDREPQLRAEAAGLLTGIGADRDISEALSGLNHADPARRLAALDRLGVLLKKPVPDLEIGSVAVLALSMLKFQFDNALTGNLLDLLRNCAPALGRNPERLAEVIRVVMGLLATAVKNKVTAQELESLLIPAHRLVNSLARAVPQALFAALEAERERSSDLVTEAFLLQSLLDLPPASEDGEQKLLERSAAYIGRDTDEGRDSRAIGVRLARRGDKAIVALCDAFAAAHMGAQKYFLILFDDIARLNKLTAASLERAAKVVLQCIDTGSKGVRMSAMECRFICDMEISEETRGALAKSIFDSISDFIFRTDIEKVEGTLARLGLPAAEPLLARLAPERPPEDRIRAVRLLGEWSQCVKAPRGQIARLQQTVTDVLRRLQALTLDEKFPDRGELLCALGKLVSSPAASKDADTVITRTLLDAAKGTDSAIVPRALEGLSYVASSRRAQADLIHATSELLRHVLDELTLDIGTDTKTVDGETIIEIKGGEKFTNFLPILLRGMSRIACSSSCPPAIMRDLGTELLRRWKKICSGELMWGPANSTLLIQALKELGCHKMFPPELRLEILRSFAPKHVQAPIMHAITEILAADDTPATAVGAVTIGFAILGRRGKEGQFSNEDREEILKALVRIAGRRVLGATSPEGQEKGDTLRKMIVDEVFKGLKDFVPHTYEALVVLRENGNLPKELREDIERRLKDYQTLAVA